MIDGLEYSDDPHSIKYNVKQYLLRERERFAGKTVVDFPAGNGVSSQLLLDVGAKPLPFDLFPEYFQLDSLSCERANINEGIPLGDGAADAVLCQEGIEHFSDQALAFKEFNRILKPGGSLIITTPNYSNLRSRLSYFLSESERYNRYMAPNELDSVWMKGDENDEEIYYGHIFLIGIQKLRCLAKLAGFKIKNIERSRRKLMTLLMFPFVFPFIYFSNWIAYRKNMRKNKNFDFETKREVYGEIFRLAINPTILLDNHLFIEFEKECELSEVGDKLKSKHTGFGTT